MGSKPRVLVVGHGEIGLALSTLETEAGNRVSIKDLRGDEGLREDQTYDVVHLCIPFTDSKSFLASVDKALAEMQIGVIIIHSTVKVGTTREIGNRLNIPTVHSFCRGTHPDLLRSFKVFEKPVGGSDHDGCRKAASHLGSLGIPTRWVSSPEASELAKLLDTTYYGYNIIFAKMAAGECEKHRLDFNEVYTWPNASYNEGYSTLGRPEVMRPVLTPTKGKIGGHCVMENLDILPKSELVDWCKKHGGDHG